jgi:hypothetical protein
MYDILHERDESRRPDPVGQLRKNWNDMTIATICVGFSDFSRKFTEWMASHHLAILFRFECLIKLFAIQA